jgi:hypothetical protein
LRLVAHFIIYLSLLVIYYDNWAWWPWKRLFLLFIRVREPKDDANDLSAKYFIETSTGMMMVWGSAVLDDKMKLVKIGKPVRITYKGAKKNAKGRDFKVFSVETGKKKPQATAQAPTPSTPTETVE